MSLREKVDASARAGIASAAKTAGGATAAFLKDPKNDAMLAGGTALVAGAQFVPGVDVGVDATLGAAGAAMYAAAGPEHRENVTKALGKLKDYTSEVGNAKSQAGLDKASKDFAAFLTIGGKEAADAIGVLRGAASAPTKFFGLAKKAQELGGIDGVTAAGSRGVRNSTTPQALRPRPSVMVSTQAESGSRAPVLAPTRPWRFVAAARSAVLKFRPTQRFSSPARRTQRKAYAVP